MPQTDIRAVLDFLRIKDEIESVHVNSTLGKHEVCSLKTLFWRVTMFSSAEETEAKLFSSVTKKIEMAISISMRMLNLS